MNEAHTTKYSVHPVADKMYYDRRDLYWWPKMKKDIAMHVNKCLTYSKFKAKHQKPSGLLQQPKIPKGKWENITMDFITRLPRTSSGHDSIWVIVDRLTKSAHFLAVRKDYMREKLAKLYINKIVARHRVLVSIISDRDNMLRSGAIDFGGNWEYSSTITRIFIQQQLPLECEVCPFEALYGRKCRTPIAWAKVGESKLIKPKIIQETTEKSRKDQRLHEIARRAMPTIDEIR
nr:putative reverse transcriptase domain-containing protein [Tanacetum cinerariifolium]